ncbi:hypothetical protein ROR02_20780 [Pararhodospirillum oryzae]|uniref:Uncharacterized protein n=2 Tax=Pararhodospirillum oryzae TaxID=478448 RepID=A0A512H905_9PROT|nr:hypothetical protein ROR02_20780 [Pararhodospirillum oryzae]
MATLSDLITQREELRYLRAQGTRSVEVEGRRVEYRSDAEMAAALAALDREIAAAQSPGPVTQIRFLTTRGV